MWSAARASSREFVFFAKDEKKDALFAMAFAYEATFVCMSCVLPLVTLLLMIGLAMSLLRTTSVVARVAIASFLIIACVALIVYGTSSWMRWVRCGAPVCSTTPHGFDDRIPPNATVVGGGWSFLLNKTMPRDAPIVFTRHWRGMLPDGRWGAGTSIGELQRALTRQGLTVASHPSILSTTLGGWIFSGAHGQGGSLWTSCFGTVTVRDTHTGLAQRGSIKSFFNDTYSIAAQRRYVVMDVEVKPVTDVWCEKIALRICDVDEMDRFLTEATHLRLLQIGARGTLAILWIPRRQQLTHVDPHLGSQTGLWLQADILSMFQGPRPCDEDWFAWPVEPPENWHSNVRLSDANDFTPRPLPFLESVSLLYINFELFVYVTASPSLLLALCDELSLTFAKMQARCELRYGDSGKLFLDFVHARGESSRRICEAVARILGTRKVFLHKGKAQVDVRPLIVADVR